MPGPPSPLSNRRPTGGQVRGRTSARGSAARHLARGSESTAAGREHPDGRHSDRAPPPQSRRGPHGATAEQSTLRTTATPGERVSLRCRGAACAAGGARAGCGTAECLRREGGRRGRRGPPTPRPRDCSAAVAAVGSAACLARCFSTGVAIRVERVSQLVDDTESMPASEKT